MDSRFCLLTDLYELTMAQAYFYYKRNTWATFDLFIRQSGPNRAFFLSAGLEDILEYIKNLKFTSSELGYLAGRKLFKREFLDYLAHLRFRGDIWAMPEATVFFPGEPVLRVTAPIIQAQLIESFLLNTINLQTMIASKAARVVLAAQGKGLFDFSLRRAQGPDAAIKVSRCSYLAGFDATSNVLAGKTYGIPIAGTMAHSFIMSFKHEIDGFLAYASVFPEKTILLVDTYNTVKGIDNAVTVGLYLKEKGYSLQGIRLDSGDIAGLSKLARQKLDAAGLKKVKIFASGNLDEFKVKNLLEKKARVDSFGVGTNMGVSIDAPCLDVVYKISEVTDEEGGFLPKMKLSRGKSTYPGRKQVYRVFDAKGKMMRDIIALEGEKVKGVPLLKKVVSRGKVVYPLYGLDRLRMLSQKNLEQLPAYLRQVYPRKRYPVAVSPRLCGLQRSLSRHLEKRQ